MMKLFKLETLMWKKITCGGEVFSPRRAHTAVVYKDMIYCFGGGDGAKALNETFVLDTSKEMY
jgi:hypothetical protein